MSNKKFKIIRGKTYSQYYKKYSRYINNCKLISFSKDEIQYMHDKKYWEIDGKYYQIPKCKLLGFLFGTNTKFYISTITISLLVLSSIIVPTAIHLNKPISECLNFTSLEDDSRFYAFYSGDFLDNELPNMQYSFDKKNWTNIRIVNEKEPSTPYFVSLKKDEKIYLKGDNKKSFSLSENKFIHFAVKNNKEEDIRFKSNGNIMSLIDNGNCNELTIPCEYCFTRLFSSTDYVEECRVVTPPSLPAINLKKECYSYMFFDNPDLVSAPELPSLKMEEKCYAYMFSQCVMLKRAPVLRASITAPYCYDHMFYGNASLSYMEIHINSWDREGDFPCCFWVSFDGKYPMSKHGTFRCKKELVPDVNDLDNFSETRIPYDWKIETF